MQKVASPWSPAVSTWLCCDGRVVSYCSANHRTEDLRDATPGQAADSLANAGDSRKTGPGQEPLSCLFPLTAVSPHLALSSL
jgi:hypothetical protein